MEGLQKHTLLLSILATLLVAKFIVVPIIDWQNNKVSEIRLMEKKFNKTHNVIKHASSFKDINEQLNIQLKGLEQLLHTSESESIFKLKQQEKIESLLNNHQLTSQNIGWKPSVSLNEFEIEKLTMSLSLSGDMDKILPFLWAIEVQRPYIEIDSFSITIRGQNQKSLGRATTANLTLNFYHELETNKVRNN
ncbi:GspMb/PilO family protein [Thalassotalea marina]|uniref:GspMb/PilO family protein n=1 Tax=Thalassotalea marina TaxID=1673741 RepID=UPI0016784282|nr:GspMb/PilO family protein [Thalassotalea marina]